VAEVRLLAESLKEGGAVSGAADESDEYGW